MASKMKRLSSLDTVLKEIALKINRSNQSFLVSAK